MTERPLAGRWVPGIALRAATPADSEFCFQVHKAAMGAYVTAIWGWDEQAQWDLHAGAFNPGRWQIITAGDVDVGVLDAAYRSGEIHLARIEIRPDHQGHGIGSQLIGALIYQGRQQGRDLVLDVLTINHRARALYHRLGMREVVGHDHGRKITMRLSLARDDGTH